MSYSKCPGVSQHLWGRHTGRAAGKQQEHAANTPLTHLHLSHQMNVRIRGEEDGQDIHALVSKCFPAPPERGLVIKTEFADCRVSGFRVKTEKNLSAVLSLDQDSETRDHTLT